jgi:hypothetical protein
MPPIIKFLVSGRTTRKAGNNNGFFGLSKVELGLRLG